MSLELQNLSFAYDQKMILKDITLTLHPGEILAILGPNACGKTTLIKNMAGLLQPHGTLLWDDTPLHQLSRNEVAKRIAYVPQDEEIFLSYTVEDIVLMGRAPYLSAWGFETAEDRCIVAEVMEQTQTTLLKDRFLEELSGGERQRVFLARALAQKTSLVLLDEPTSHLDLHYQASLLELCHSLNKKFRQTFVLSLHDINLASLFADRILLMREGSVFALGKTEEVLTENHLRDVYQTPLRLITHPTLKKPVMIMDRLP